MTFKEKRHERIRKKQEKKEQIKEKRKNEHMIIKILRVIGNILSIIILIPIIGVTALLVLIYIQYNIIENRYEVKAVKGMHYGEKILNGDKVRVIAKDSNLDYKVEDLDYFYEIDPNLENLGMKVVNYKEYISIMEEFTLNNKSGINASGFDTDDKEEPSEEEIAKQEEERKAKKRDSWYKDESKNYIIVSDYSSNQMLSDVVLCDIEYNHKNKTITVYVVDEFYGCVGNSSGYIMAIPTDECDETYTVEYKHVLSKDEYIEDLEYSLGFRQHTAAKPVIYLYPENKTFVQVELDFDGELTTTYPVYKDKWEVTAYPDGTLIDNSGREYNYLFWEGKSDVEYNFSEGFCIKGDDTIEFLEESLTKLGLSDKEQADFITYWAPKMENNNYNLISFQTDVYEEQVKLTVTGEDDVDTEIRVFMAWQGLDSKIEIKEQELKAPERKGFTLVEWGGCEVEK